MTVHYWLYGRVDIVMRKKKDICVSSRHYIWDLTVWTCLGGHLQILKTLRVWNLVEHHRLFLEHGAFNIKCNVFFAILKISCALFPFTPIWSSFLIRMWWWTVLNAFERSIKTLRVKWFFWKLFLICSVSWIIVCSVECFSLKPNCFYKAFHLLLNI